MPAVWTAMLVFRVLSCLLWPRSISRMYSPSLKVFLEHGRTLGEAITYAEHLFAQTGTIRLTTGHKAKGLEWDTVYHLDEHLLGSDEQNKNLRYVIQTRSKDRYYEIDSMRIKW